MKYVNIFTEGGKDIGFGHLTRCNAIAEQLRDMEVKVRIFAFLKEMSLDSQEVNDIDWHNKSPEDFISAEDIVVIDSYLVSNKWLKAACNRAKKLVHLDDFNRTEYPVDLIINPNVFAQDLDYSNQLATWVGGPDYVVLRKSFRILLPKSVPSIKVSILITMGGSDYRGLLPILAQWCFETGDFEVKIIVPDGLSVFPKGSIVLPLLNEIEMAQEMANADFVISGCGQTLHELASFKKSVIGIGLDLDQIPNHKFYNEIGFISENIWWDEPELKSKVKKEILRLSNRGTRVLQANRRPPINVNGVEKVAAAIIN